MQQQDDEFDKLVKEFSDLVATPGISAVSNWKLPNNDGPFHGEIKATEFEEDADKFALLLNDALDLIGTNKEE